MKKLLFISSLIILFNSCKKDTTEPATEKEAAPVHITNYSITVAPRMKNFQDDTLIVKINNSVVLKKYQSGILETYIYNLKTNDNINVFYNPGKVQSGSAVIADENGLIVFADHDNINGELYNANCRCTTNFNYTFK